MLFLNLGYQNTASSAAASDETPTAPRQVAKVEGISNEVCKLRFEKNVLGDIFGVYTGDEGAYEGLSGGLDIDTEGVHAKLQVDRDALTPLKRPKGAKVIKGKKATSFSALKGKGKSKGKRSSK